MPHSGKGPKLSGRFSRSDEYTLWTPLPSASGRSSAALPVRSSAGRRNHRIREFLARTLFQFHDSGRPVGWAFISFMAFFSLIRVFFILGRISNLPTVWTNVLVGWFLCGGNWSPELAWIALGVSGLYLGGMTLNDAFDADWDREFALERPIPAGKISRSAVWAIGVVEMLVGVLVLLALTTFHPLILVGLVQAILLYNFLHKRWKGSVLIMGLCRALVYVGAGSAVVAQTNSIEVSPVVYFVAVAVILYIAGLTLAARSEHLKSPSGISYLNRLMLTLPVLFPLFASRTMPPGPVQTALIILGVIGIWSWIVIMRKALSEKIPKGIAFAIAGIAFFDAATVAFADWRAAVLCLALFGITLVAQRFIPAT